MAQKRQNGVRKNPKSLEVEEMEKNRKFKLVSWDELPDWQRDNEHIVSGYRPASFSLYRSIESMRMVHNDTVNIYSHLFGAVTFFSFPYAISRLLPHLVAKAQLSDIVVFSTFFSEWQYASFFPRLFTQLPIIVPR